jgi:DNA-binding MarR family transcriptional regulator
VTTPVGREELTNAVLGVSRALIGIALRTLAQESPDLTLVQFRALATLNDHGSQRVADLAGLLGVNSSTATRMSARLRRKGLLTRNPDPDDRRATRLQITASGEAVVRAVTARRQEAIDRIACRIPDKQRAAFVESMYVFTAAAGDVPEQDWTRGWAR